MKKVVVGLMILMLVGMVAVFGQAAAKKVSIAVVWSGQELQAFQDVIAQFEKETGIQVTIEPVGRDLPTYLVVHFKSGNPPDVAAMPNPGQMKQFVDQNALVPLENIIDLSQQPKGFVDLATVNGHVYGIFMDADVKSLVWYNPKAFAAKGYKVPQTWDELMALTQQIARSGGTPWSIGLESGAASGWPGTDWIEDLVLRISGPQVYDLWVQHKISWLNPCIKAAWEAFGEIALNSKYVYGGTAGELSTNFGDAANPLFTNPPGAYMLKQATFMQSFIQKANPNLKPGEDYDIFPFPPMGPGMPTPIEGSGDLMSVFNNTPEAQALIKYLASAEAQTIFAKKLGKLAVNKTVNPDIYTNPITKKAFQILSNAQVFRFDGSDMMPAQVGSGTFWTGVLDYVNGTPLDTVLTKIEQSAETAYTK